MNETKVQSSSFGRLRVSFELLHGFLAIARAIFIYYVIAIVQSVLTGTFFILSPIVRLLDGSTQELNDIIYHIHERFIIFMGFREGLKRVVYYGDFDTLPREEESVIVICNHQSEADYVVMAAAMDKAGCLKRMRHIMKKMLIYIPFVGAFLVKRRSLFIDRGNVDWKRFDENCEELASSKLPATILIYPEGTTWNNALEYPEILRKSKELAESHGEPAFSYVMFPKHRGMHRVLSKMRNKLAAVYNLTFAYKSAMNVDSDRPPAPGIMEFVSGSEDAHVHLERIDIKDIPETEGELHTFLVDCFRRKNESLRVFFETGSFPSSGEVAKPLDDVYTIHSIIYLLVLLSGFVPFLFWFLWRYMAMIGLYCFLSVVLYQFVGSNKSAL